MRSAYCEFRSQGEADVESPLISIENIVGLDQQRQKNALMSFNLFPGESLVFKGLDSLHFYQFYRGLAPNFAGAKIKLSTSLNSCFISYIGEHAPLWENKTLEQAIFLSFDPDMHGSFKEFRQKIWLYIDELNLSLFLKQKIAQLSQGTRVKLVFLLSYLSMPDLYMVSGEFLAKLEDLSEQEKIIQMIKKDIIQRKKAVIWKGDHKRISSLIIGRVFYF